MNFHILNADRNIPYFNIDYTKDHEAEALNYLDRPKTILGMTTGKVTPYIIIFTDTVGTSPLEGGSSMVIGYSYPGEQTYGAQVALKYNAYKKRHADQSGWSSWEDA